MLSFKRHFFIFFTLIHKGFPLGGIFLSLAWLGDRALVEVLLGRPEGVALLFLACSFVALVAGLKEAKWYNFFLVGLLIGVAGGFNPGCFYFAFATGLSYFFHLNGKKAIEALFFSFIGGALTLFLWLLCWRPNINASFEQFVWFVRFSTDFGVSPFSYRISSIWSILKWSQWWVMALMAVTVLFSAVLAGNLILRLRSGTDKKKLIINNGSLQLPLILFAVSGMVVFFKSSMYPYYIVLFSNSIGR